MKQDRQIEMLCDMMRRLVKEKFYGEVLVKFEHGHILPIKKTESIKLEEVGGINSSSELGRAQKDLCS